MAPDRFDRSALTRVDSVSEEICAINRAILDNLERLPKRPDLVSQLVRRCDALSKELDAIRADLRIQSKPDPRPADSTAGVPSDDVSALQA